VPELKQLHTGHAPAVLALELANRGYFAASVSERGDEFFDLYDFQDGTANLGYRVAQHVAGRGVATSNVRELGRLAATRHGLCTLRAATDHANAASQKVLTKAGFVPLGPAEPADLGGKPGTWYQRNLQLQP
jgi:ribosomal-protein-alanine N-acetyltransferase